MRRRSGVSSPAKVRATASFASTMNISISVWVNESSSFTASITWPASSNTRSTSGRSRWIMPAFSRRARITRASLSDSLSFSMSSREYCVSVLACCRAVSSLPSMSACASM